MFDKFEIDISTYIDAIITNLGDSDFVRYS